MLTLLTNGNTVIKLQYIVKIFHLMHSKSGGIMNKKVFKIRAGQPYITLNKLLQVLGIAQTGGHAKIMIQNEEVLVNGLVETRVRNKLFKGDIVSVESTQIEIE